MFEIKARAFLSRRYQIEIQSLGKKKAFLSQRSCVKGVMKTASRMVCLPPKVAPDSLPAIFGKPARDPAQMKQEKQDRKKANQKKERGLVPNGSHMVRDLLQAMLG